MNTHKAEERAKILNKALNGYETDEITIINVMTSQTKDELQMVKDAYFNLYKISLENDLKKQTRGYFLESVLALLLPTYEYEAKCLRKAITGLETNLRVITQILCTKESNEIQAIRDAYQKLYNQNLEKELETKEGGALGRIFRSLLQGLRPESTDVEETLAKREANELYEAGKGKVVVEEMEFVRILCSRSFIQLKSTFEEYYSLFKIEIENSIKDVIRGPLLDACLTIVKCATNKAKYFAEQIHKALKGIFTKNDDLIRVIISRNEIDLSQIKIIYHETYGQKLYDTIKNRIGGNYGKLFLAIIGRN